MNKYYVVLVGDRSNKTFEIQGAYHPQHKHLEQLMQDVMFEGKKEKVFVWGDYMYRPIYVNSPIKLRGDYYQIIELYPFGHYYTIEISDDGKSFDEVHRSKSYLSYDECYNAMKLEAVQMIAADVDIQQDFEDGTEYYKHLIEFRANQIEISTSSNKTIKLFKIC